jgi:putative ATPase
MGIWRAREDVRNGVGGEVPVHLRDAHYRSARSLGHGVGYEYPHDDRRRWLPERYLPDDAADAVYYRPSGHGFEQEIATRMERLAQQPDADENDAEEPE